MHLNTKNTQFEGFLDKNEGINSNYIKLNNFSWEYEGFNYEN